MGSDAFFGDEVVPGVAGLAGQAGPRAPGVRKRRTAAERREALARGARAESLVCDRLVGRGWALLARNWRGAGGELDLVVGHHGKLRFVEVKVREPGDPLADDAVSPHKRRRLKRAAEAWLAAWPEPFDEACFLVAYVDARVDPWSVRWLDDAF